jgi:large subunit ribosomal protein L10
VDNADLPTEVRDQDKFVAPSSYTRARFVMCKHDTWSGSFMFCTGGGIQMGAREEKALQVQEISDRLTRSKTTVVTDYRGLSAGEVTELRKQLREAGIEFHVYKNTLTRRATAATMLTELDAYLTGPSAIAFGFDDVVLPAKILNSFARKNKALEIKGGIVEGRIVGAEGMTELANLPSREGLLSMLLSVLQAPMRNMAYALKQIADQQTEGVTVTEEAATVSE